MAASINEQATIEVWNEIRSMSTRLSRAGSLAGSRRSGSIRNWGVDFQFVGPASSSRREDNDDEEDLKWAALERLPTYDRLRTTFVDQLRGSRMYSTQVNLRDLGPDDHKELLRKVFNASSTQEDNKTFLLRLRDRLQRVDIAIPTVEVRYENVNIEAQAHVGNRALPTLYNAGRNSIESFLSTLGLPVTKMTNVTILKEVSGIIKPGRLTLLLGPPGSGKTSLLLALAGRLASDLKVRGEVTYNGHTFKEFVPQKTAAYVSQHDLHLGDMTVRETLDFSARCQGVGQRNDLLTELVRREKEAGIHPEADVDFFMKATSNEDKPSGLVSEYILRLLGLDICADTMVGDEMRRGVSGGQRKRVTSGELIVGPMKTLFMDEISTGLDSSTTFQIVKCLGDVARVLDSTVVISLLQPAPETYDLFDDIILLSEGQTVYHGPRENILEFFESMGYKCPERKGVADFLQEVTSRKDQGIYWEDKTRPYMFTPVNEFLAASMTFHTSVARSKELAEPFDKSKSHRAALAFNRYSVSTKELFKANFEKEWLLTKRNSFIFVIRGLQLAIAALIAASVFLRTNMKRNNLGDAQTFSGALFFGVVSIMFNGFAELSLTIMGLPVFYKQRDLFFYPAWTFTIPKIVQSIPMSLLSSVIWGSITYYAIGFAPNMARFGRQLLLFFWVHQMSSGMFRMIAGLSRTMIIANTGGSMGLLVVFLLGGFLITRPSIKPWWIWGYWFSPLSYAQNAVDVNEFLAPQWNKIVDASGVPLGVEFLKNQGKFTRGYWYWLGIGALIGYTVLFNIIFTLALTYLRPLGRKAAMVSEEEVAERHANVTGEDLSAELAAKQSSLPRASFSGEMPAALNPRESELLEMGGIMAKRGMILPFQPLSISFDDIKYFVDMPAEMKQNLAGGLEDDRLQLLRGVTGSFRPGVLTALVGVSGAGKSTLMDVLAGRKTGGYIEGDIRISGFPKDQETFARISGYCEQNDIHSPQVTVYESLVYSAWLRLGREVDDTTKTLFVEQVMDLVELTTLKDALVGLPGVSGLSTDQRKRLTIAVELVANPSIIFMDEPTSGLDARAAAIVMRTVRNTVDTGRAVVCTIHQPSIDIFEAFDELLLMKRGGEVIYAGPLGRQSCKLVEYFEAIPGVPTIKETYNPATWMLEVSSNAMEQHLAVDFAEVYRNSPLFQKNKASVRELGNPAPSTKDLWFPSQYAQPFFSQLKLCLWKQHMTYWRSPDYNNVRLFFTVFAAVLFGTIFWRLGLKRTDPKNLFFIFGAMFGASLFIGINNASTVQPVVATERTIFYRERAAGMYSASPYAIAQVLIELPYVFMQVILYGFITYAMIGLEWTTTKVVWYLFCMFFTFLYFTFYGMMAVGLTPNQQIAAIVAAFFYGIFNLFSGFLIFKSKIPKWWLWYYWMCPVAWTLYGLIVSQFGDVTETLNGSTITIKEYVESTFGYSYNFLPYVAVMLVAFPVLFASVFMFAIKFFNFQKR